MEREETTRVLVADMIDASVKGFFLTSQRQFHIAIGQNGFHFRGMAFVLRIDPETVPFPEVTMKSALQRFGFLAAVTVFVACSDPVTSPNRATMTVPSKSHAQLSWADDSTITVTDPSDGTSFTLSPDAQEVRANTGVSIELDSADVVEFTNGFLRVAEGDTYGDQIDAGPPPEGEGHGGPCGWSPCEQSTGWTMFRIDSVSSKTYPGQQWGVFLDRPKGKSHPHDKVSGTVTAQDGYSCSDLAGAIKDALPAYRASRVTVMQALKSILSQMADWENGHPVIKKPSWQAVAADMANAFANSKIDEVAMTITLTLYNSYGCYEVYAGFVESQSLGGTMRLVCHGDYGSISIDGGQTWHLQYVSVCVYQMS
jgi:hypothetical protein